MEILLLMKGRIIVIKGNEYFVTFRIIFILKMFGIGLESVNQWYFHKDFAMDLSYQAVISNDEDYFFF